MDWRLEIPWSDGALADRGRDVAAGHTDVDEVQVAKQQAAPVGPGGSGGSSRAVVIVLAGAGVGTWFATRSTLERPPPASSRRRSVQTVTTGTITQTVAATGTIEPATTADLNFAVSGKVTAVDVTAGQVGRRRPDAGHRRPDRAQRHAGPGPGHPGQRPGPAGHRPGRPAHRHPDRPRQRQHRLGAEPGDRGPDGRDRRHAGVDHGRHRGVGRPHRGPAGDRLVAPRPRRAPAVHLRARPARTGSTGASARPASGARLVGGVGVRGVLGGLVVLVAARWSWCRPAPTSSTPPSRAAGSPRSRWATRPTITPSGATTPVYGTVGSIGLVATTTSGVSSFPVVIDVTGSPSGLYGGTSANVSIIVKELQGVVVVPTGAITYTNGTTAVTLDARRQEGGPARHRPASPSAGDTQIVSGLTAGQKIYVTTVSFHGPLGHRPDRRRRLRRLRRLGTRRLRRRHGRLRRRRAASAAVGGFGG